MATEKFIAFKEDGTAYRLKGRILRFLDNEPVSESDKTNIRSTLSVPASAEGLTPANNLSDLDNAATARTNLSVNSIDEDAEATGTKLVGPALHFDGSDDFITNADSGSLAHFNDGTDDLPFTVEGWVKLKDATSSTIISKFGTTAGTREWYFYTDSSDLLTFSIRDTAENGIEQVYANTALTSYEGEWIHIAASFAGAGPNSTNSFLNAADGMTLYVNGSPVATTNYSNGSYSGMLTDTGVALDIGRSNNSGYFDGEMRQIRIHNRELTADEVSQLARGTDLGFADEWGGAHGGVYTSDFTSDSTNSFSITRTTLDAVSTVGGDTDNLKIVSDATASATHSATRASSSPASAKRATIRGEYYIPSGQTAVDGFDIYIGASSTKNQIINGTTNAWTFFEFEADSLRTNTNLYIYLTDGGVQTFNGVSGEYVAFRNIKVTEIGTLADFRAEDFNESAGKLLDRSSNNFVGTGTGVTLTGKHRHISAATLDLTDIPTSSAGLSAGEVWNNGGVLSIV